VLAETEEWRSFCCLTRAFANDAYVTALGAFFSASQLGRYGVTPSAVPLLPPNRLSKWCVYAAVILLLVGFGLMRGAASIDVTVFGGTLMGLGCVVGFWAYKLDPKVVQRFFRD
jgi:hypothetical protein